MKILSKAGSESYRLTRPGVGASDLPGILEMSPFPGDNGYAKFLIKTGRAVQPPPNEAMLQGSAREEEAVQFAEKQLGVTFDRQVIAQHDGFPYCYASADGWNAEKRIYLEVKCPSSRTTIDYLRKYDVPPPHYMAQLDQQAEIFDPSEVYFIVYHGPDEFSVWQRSRSDIVKMRDRWRTDWLPHVQQFQRAVESGEWPRLSGKAEAADPQWVEGARAYMAAKNLSEKFESEASEWQAVLKRLSNARISEAAGYKAEWRLFKPSYKVTVECTSAEAAARVTAALTVLSKASEVKSIKQQVSPETLRFYFSGGDDDAEN